MPRIANPSPFEGYACYKVFHKKMQRDQVCLVPLHPDGSLNRNGKRRTLTYAKFLMSIETGRILEAHEEVDHKDGNKTNDDMDNLQILSRGENRKKRNLQSAQVIWSIQCPNCEEWFDMPRKEVRFRRRTNKKGLIFCSRICVGQYYRPSKQKGQ